MHVDLNVCAKKTFIQIVNLTTACFKIQDKKGPSTTILKNNVSNQYHFQTLETRFKSMKRPCCEIPSQLTDDVTHDAVDASFPGESDERQSNYL